MRKDEIFGKAEFVSARGECASPCFFGKFYAEPNKKTEIIICGLGFFKLYINGSPASRDVLAPVTSFYHKQPNCFCEREFGEEMSCRIYVVKYDISSLVHSGENELCAVVGTGWYGEFSHRCVLCYKVTSGKYVSYSDGSVLWSPSPLVYYDIHKGETQDYSGARYSALGLPLGERFPVEITSLPETEFCIQDCPNDRIIRSVLPKKISEANGYAVYDVGENISGTYVLSCPYANSEISVSGSEALGDDGDIDKERGHGQSAKFLTDGSEREYGLMFTWHAFRYFKAPTRAEVKRVDVIHSDINVSSEFRCENQVLSWFFEAYIRTQLCNMHAGIPSDCPHIERRGYTGDGQLTCETAMLTLDAKKFYLKWMEDISDCQDKNSGHVQYTAPYFKCGGGPGGWGCAIAEVPYTFYKMYGDIGPMKKYFSQMLRYLDYLEAHSENDLVVSDQPGLWCLGEWCVPGNKRFTAPSVPPPFVNTYFYIRTIDRLTELADKCGRSADAERLLPLREKKTSALTERYFDKATGNFCDNANCANAFALDIGLGDNRTLDKLVRHIKNDPLDTGIFGTDLVVKILFERGYFDEAVEFLSKESYPSFGYMKKSGATTLWEEWQNPRSMSHPMFGGAVKYLFYHILGIRRASGTFGFDKIVIEPKTNKTTGSVSGYITTQNGKISVDVSNGVCSVSSPKKTEVNIIYPGVIKHTTY